MPENPTALTQQQIDNIQIDYGIVFVNYGEDNQRRIGPTRGGGEFTATADIRDIDFDGKKGKSKGMQVVEEINAMLKVTTLDSSMENLHMAIPYATLSADKKSITCGSSNIGIIKNESYLKNITMFAKTVKGEYKKITLYSGMAENGLSFAAVPKGEGTVALEVHAHWDPKNEEQDLYKIEEVASIIPVQEPE